jgi:cell division septation protein DedD
MRGVFDDDDFDKGRQRRDTELTLSPTMLLAIFFGMVLLCGLFFGLGFALGHYGPSDSAASGQQASAPAPAVSSKAKPSATEQIAPQSQPSAEFSVGTVPATAPAANAVANTAASQPETAADSPYAGQQVRPALPQQAAQPAPQPARVQPALAPPSGLMVQVAAVSNPEDAEVLMSALQRRGYPVIVRRLAVDHLLHVQVGPFKSQDEAYQWRHKLLDDGYNAIVQP